MIKYDHYDSNDDRILSVFEAYKAHQLFEKIDGKPRIRDHV